ncbi:MAG: 2-hydroxyacyl-CoA dehydratase family protein [Candidatus Neomarinimicrobiota bacterium]
MDKFPATAPPARRQYLTEQKNRGRRLVGIFPAHYPREIFWGHNILPVEIWDPPLPVSAANAHLQPYVCSIVHHGLELILQGQTDLLDGYCFPHTCDSLQNLASIVADCLPDRKPTFSLYHPKLPGRTASRNFYRAELGRLLSSLAAEFGPATPEQWRQALNYGRRINQLITQAYQQRRQGLTAISNREFYRIVRLGEYLHPDDLIPQLERLTTAIHVEPATTIPVILSGILANPPEILSLLDEHGVRVADDDLLNCGRRLTVPVAATTDPLDALCAAYFSQPPCSTKDSPLADRLAHLTSLVHGAQAAGVIFNSTKFCEPELFDLPQLREGLRQAGIPTLVIETEINQGLSGQLQTRIEAFLEMIGN